MPCPCETTKIKTKSFHPTSYHVTVRPVTPLHVAMAVAEGYQAKKSRDSIRTSGTINIHQKDLVISEHQSSPSIPTKKIFTKNNGIEASSTSFDEQVELLPDETIIQR